MNPKITAKINGVEVRRLMSDEDVAEYRRLLNTVPDGSLVVELGSFDGGSLVSLADTINEKKLQIAVVDLFNQAMTEDFNDRGQMLGSRESCLDNLRQVGINPLVVLKKTEDVVKWLTETNRRPSMVFIDTDHEYGPVKNDIELLTPLVMPGGIISGHDYYPHHPGCVKAVNEKFPNVWVPLKTGLWSAVKDFQRFAIISSNDEHYRPLANITWTGKQAYCKKWGYDAIHFLVPPRTEESKVTEGHNQWYGFAKIKQIIDTLETGKYDWVFFSECDALITNHNISLDTIVDNEYHVLLTSNFDGINMGNLFVRNTPQGLGYMKFIYSQYPKYKNAGYAEQQAVMDSWQTNKNILRVMPQKMFNSHDDFLYDHYKVPKERRKDIQGNSGQWEPGDFQVHHCGFGLEKRLEFVKFYEDKIVNTP